MPAAYNIIGMMSGTSLDGLDICAVNFRPEERRWRFDIVAAESLPYDADRKQALRDAHRLSLEEGQRLHMAYGKYLGRCASDFMKRNKLDGLIDLVVSHGHTVLHAPGRGYTFQLGHGATISAVCGLPVVSDLRSGDVALGGQGAPIVPMGERFLFPDYRIFLNIGGIVNIAFHRREKVVAYDVCPGNTPLNLLALLTGSEYDEDGEMARRGNPDRELMKRLGTFSFYDKPVPRSLHTYQIVKEFMPVMDMSPGSPEDKLRSVTEHIAAQVAGHLSLHGGGPLESSPVMVTGGGALNAFLVERIRELSGREIVVPPVRIVEFKEALIMAFLGLFRTLERPNSLASVSGASRDSIGGAWFKV